MEIVFVFIKAKFQCQTSVYRTRNQGVTESDSKKSVISLILCLVPKIHSPRFSSPVSAALEMKLFNSVEIQ